VRPYYIVPDGKVGHDAYAVIRETIRSLDKVAIARVVLTSREHIIALEARDKGLMGMLLRYPYEVREASEYFDEIQDVKITKDMLGLARHIVDQKSGHFEPGKFEDHLRGRPLRAPGEEAKGPPDHGGQEARARQRRQSHGCAARKYPTENKTGPLFRQAGESSREESSKIEEIRLRKLPGPGAFLSDRALAPRGAPEPEVSDLAVAIPRAKEGLHPLAVKGWREPLRGP
jgi:hypothetical protein